MRVKTFLVLTAVTILTVAATSVVLIRQDRPQIEEGSGEKVFPGLKDHLNDLAEIDLLSGKRSLTISRNDHGWQVAQSDDFPASRDAIRKVLLAMIDLERVDPKTARPDLFDKLSVEDPAGDQTLSKQVTLKDSKGNILAEIIVGKSAFELGGEGGTYIRLPAEKRAWLAKGSMEVSMLPRDWLDRRIVDISPSDIRSIEITKPGEAPIVATKSAPTDADFELQGVPKGKHVRSEEDVDAMALPLTQLDFDDVKAATQASNDATPLATGRFETFSGMVINVDLIELDGKKWFRLRPLATSSESGSISLDAMQAVAAFEDRTKPWIFQVPKWKSEVLEKRMDDLVTTDPSGS